MRIFVGCSASDDLDNKYYNEAMEIGCFLAKDNDLVFGAGYYGIMKTIYDCFKKQNRYIIAVTPNIYKKDLNKIKCDKKILVNTINERTDAFINNSDVFLFLPGGTGTLCEFFSILEEKRTNKLNKKIIILNSFGFFDELIMYLNKLYDLKFLFSEIKALYKVVDNKEELMEELYGENDNGKNG